MQSAITAIKKTISKCSMFIIGFACASCLFWLVQPAYSAKAPQILCNAGSNALRDQAEAQTLYHDFTLKYPAFGQLGGSIPKSVLCALYTGMTDPKDTKVYFYFARNKSNENCLLFFADPTYHPNITGSAYKTAGGFCPPECSLSLTEYLR